MFNRPILERSIFLRPIAHRGLHDAAAGIIENTAPAFEAAIARGYGVECDLRPLSDGTPIVFHDETLTRLIDDTTLHPAPNHPRAARLRTRSEGREDPYLDNGTRAADHETLVTSLSPGDLTHLRYTNSDTPILSFADLLILVSGAVPLLVEIKSEWTSPDPRFLAQISALALAYRGPIALMSFDPAVIASLKSLAPAIPRGLVSGCYSNSPGDHWWQDKLTASRAAHLRDLNDFAPLGCSFAAYQCAALPTQATQSLRSAGFPIFTWTVRSDGDRAHADLHADAMIFEGFVP